MKISTAFFQLLTPGAVNASSVHLLNISPGSRVAIVQVWHNNFPFSQRNHGNVVYQSMLNFLVRPADAQVRSDVTSVCDLENEILLCTRMLSPLPTYAVVPL